VSQDLSSPWLTAAQPNKAVSWSQCTVARNPASTRRINPDPAVDIAYRSSPLRLFLPTSWVAIPEMRSFGKEDRAHKSQRVLVVEVVRFKTEAPSNFWCSTRFTSGRRIRR